MNNKMTIIWAISLFVLSIAALFLIGANIMGIEIPDILKRVLGIVSLIAVFVFGFAFAHRIFSK